MEGTYESHRHSDSGSYIIRDTPGAPAVTVPATGSEVSRACETAELAAPVKVRVLALPSKELPEAADYACKAQLIGSGTRVMAVEAGVKQVFEGWVKSPKEDIFPIDRFGESGTAKKVAAHRGFTAATLAAHIKGEA